MTSQNPLRAVTRADRPDGPEPADAAVPELPLSIGPVGEALELVSRAIETEPPLREPLVAAQASLERAIATAHLPWVDRIAIRWGALFYIVLTGIAQMAFIEMYCRWHGAWFLFPNPFRLYDPANIDRLARMDFVAYVNGVPTTMSVAAEVMMWSSLGVWAQRLFGMSRRYQRRLPDFPHDVATYIGILARNTSIAATVIIILRLSDFSVFGVSLDRFDATVGTAFLLGFFGGDTYKLLCKIRDGLFGQTPGERAAEDP